MSLEPISVTEQKRRADVLNSIEGIYYVYPISFSKINLEEELDKDIEDFEKMRGCKVVDREKYVKYLHLHGEDKVSISGFISSYHVTETEAMKYAIQNVGDINEAGCYNYCAVVRAPVGHTYYNTSQNPDEDIILLKYNRKRDVYEILEGSEEEYEVIKYHVWGMYFDTERLPW